MTKQPDLRSMIRLADVAALAGYTVKTIQIYMCEPDFPKAAAVIGRTHFWNPADIKKWTKARAKIRRKRAAA